MTRMLVCMTEHHIVQARLSGDDLARLDADRATLGLDTRSAAIREGMRLLHRQARHVALAREYDDFYGVDGAVLSDISAAGDVVATLTLHPEP